MIAYLSHEDIVKMEAQAASLFQQEAFSECERTLKQLIAHEPLNSDYFQQLGRVQERLGAVDAAKVAFRRERQLSLIEANSKRSLSVDRLDALWSLCSDEVEAFVVDGYRFSPLAEAESVRRDLCARISLCGEAWLEWCLSPEDAARFERETECYARFTESGCQTAPRLLASGRQIPDERLAAVAAFDGAAGVARPYRIVSSTRADRGGLGYGDLVLALLEQQALGIYNNLLSIRNMRFDSIARLLRFGDYSEAVHLSDAERQLKAKDFLNWCVARERQRVKSGGEASYLLMSCQGQEWIWKEERLNLAATQLFRAQRQKRIPEARVQSVSTPGLMMEGAIDWTRKAAILSEFSFTKGETVVDLGCATGAGARYLAAQGCEVTGLDVDERLLRAADLLSHVEGLKIRYLEKDIEYEPLDEEWDTVLLLSVFQNFKNPEAVGARLAASCRRRILIECGLREQGFSWLGNFYRPGPAWSFENEQALCARLEGYFPGFRLRGTPVESLFERKIYRLEREEGSDGA